MKLNRFWGGRSFWMMILLVFVLGFLACGKSSSNDPDPKPGPIDSSGSCDWVAGTWETSETSTGCDESITESKTYTVTQTGCDITVSVDDLSFSGTVSGNRITWSGQYPEEGGTTTITALNLTISDENLSGSSTWTWSDGDESCSGSTQVTGQRTTIAPKEDDSNDDEDPEPNPDTDDDTSELPTDPIDCAEKMVVGAWTTTEWSTSVDDYILAHYFICPSGRLKGVEQWSWGWDALAKGTWSVEETTRSGMEQYPSIMLNYTTTIGRGGETNTGPGDLGQRNGYMIYDAEDDLISYYFNGAWFYMHRVIDGDTDDMDDADCASAISPGSDQCGTDADCGRCYYCDKSGSTNTCRYGGEGPNGCYRGWDPN